MPFSIVVFCRTCYNCFNTDVQVCNLQYRAFHNFLELRRILFPVTVADLYMKAWPFFQICEYFQNKYESVGSTD